jgi:hypothetical protein
MMHVLMLAQIDAGVGPPMSLVPIISETTSGSLEFTVEIFATASAACFPALETFIALPW